MSINKIHLVAFLGIMIFLYWAATVKDKEWCEENNLNFYESSFTGRVKKSFIDSTNHLYPTLIMRDGYKYYVREAQDPLYRYVKTGDSINKQQNSYNIIIIRNGKSRVFDQYIICR